MAITTVLFDLDGTLLPMDQERFVKAYFKGLAQKAAPYGYEPGKLIETIWAGTSAMVKNTGAKTNEEVFWDLFAMIYGEEARADEALFSDFYHHEFQQVQASCGFQPKAKDLIELLQNKGMRLVLATNPIFPAIATQSRIRWAGLKPEDFVYWSTYENSHFCKPNLDYYREILNKLGISPAECLMIGNDVDEDMVTRQLGMRVFLLTDCLLNKGNKDLAQYPHGDFAELIAYINDSI